MRYFLLFTIVFASLIGCTKDTENLNITGTIKGLKKGTLLLQKFEDTLLVNVDSILIDGKSDFIFSTHLESPEMYYLLVRLKDGSLKDDRIAFFAEKGNINIETQLNNFGNSARISGSANDSIWRNYDKIKRRFVSRNLDLIEEQLKLKSNSPDSLAWAIDDKQQKLLTNNYYTTINFAINHKDYEVAPFLILTEAPNSNVKYLDTVYDALSPKVKDSKYGKELESFIRNRKEVDSL